MTIQQQDIVAGDSEETIQARYEMAKTIFKGHVPSDNKLVCNDAVFPHWIDGSPAFWYLRQTRAGKEFRLVDAEAATNKPAFNHEALATAFTKVSGQQADPENLPVKMIDINLQECFVYFFACDTHWCFYLENQECNEVTNTPKGIDTPDSKTSLFCPLQDLVSPDGTQIVFVKDHNLWLRDQKTGTEKALTLDGEELYSYGDSVALSVEDNLQAAWSPDGQKLFAVQLDQRKITKRPYIEYMPFDGSLHPKPSQQARAYPGDKNVGCWKLIVFDVAMGKELFVDYKELPLLGYGSFFTDKRGWWSADSRSIYFIDENRGATKISVNRFDLDSGKVTTLFEEVSDTFVKLAHTTDDLPLFLPSPETEELIWFSERSGWGHLYLYSLKTGQQKNVITEGSWVVREVLNFNTTTRELLIQTAGRDIRTSPYYADICTVNVDTGKITEIATGNFEHTIYKRRSVSYIAFKIRDMQGYDSSDVHGISPDGQYIVATKSRVDTVPESILYSIDGKEVMPIELADVQGLPEGWVWPEPVQAKAADGKTNIYGTIFYPANFSADQSYPVIDHIHGGRGFGSVPVGSFCNSAVFGFGYNQCMVLANLGFIVVSIEGRGCPRRSKAFQDHRFGDVSAGNDPDDHVAAIRELAQARSFMDLHRVGMSGHDANCSGLYGFLKHQDFYKAAVVQFFIDAQFNMTAAVETYEGLSPNHAGLERCRPIEDYASNLKGNLLLISGLLEFQTPTGTFRLVDALQKANKDFDLLILPRQSTDPTGYTMRRDWDFMVRNLQGLEPPKGFKIEMHSDEMDSLETGVR